MAYQGRLFQLIKIFQILQILFLIKFHRFSILITPPPSLSRVLESFLKLIPNGRTTSIQESIFKPLEKNKF